MYGEVPPETLSAILPELSPLHRRLLGLAVGRICSLATIVVVSILVQVPEVIVTVYVPAPRFVRSVADVLLSSQTNVEVPRSESIRLPVSPKQSGWTYVSA